MSVCTSGLAPAPGDEALISKASVHQFPAVRWLTVEHVEPCADDRWVWLTGRWTDDNSTGRVMVWLDRLVVRLAARPSTTSTGR